MDDLTMAKKYINKAHGAQSSGISFLLSFTSYKNLMQAKKCGYTGIELTSPRSGENIRSTDRTIDRIDNSLGYVKGNVVAVCSSANKMKALWENPNNPLDMQSVKKMIHKVESYKKEAK